jgi:cellulose synthase/poly-beta-1,6-N-acetylglucosamine synthase-like glycosyltransferase
MISVVLSCYNRAAFLARAIDSVLAQGAHASQVIVVNDGSTDCVDRQICRQHTAESRRFVWPVIIGDLFAWTGHREMCGEAYGICRCSDGQALPSLSHSLHTDQATETVGPLFRNMIEQIVH